LSPGSLVNLPQMLVVSIGVVMPQVTKQWDVERAGLITASLYTGSLIGAVLCGYFLDIVGRKLVWQGSLFVVTVFTLIAAGSPNFTALAIFIGLQTIGAGGNSM
jgi:MFS family permease